MIFDRKTNPPENLVQIKDLPTPRGHPILGHLPAFRKPNVHQIAEEWVRACGDLFRIRLGPTTVLVSADPAINMQIATQRPHDFGRLSKMNDVFHEMGIIGAFSTEGDTWRRHRKPVARALNVRKIRRYFPVLQEKTAILLDQFRARARQGDPVEVQKHFMRFTVDVTSVIAFGYDLDTMHKKEHAFQRQLERVFPMIQERTTAPFPIWRYIKRKKDRELDRALTAIKSTIQTFIDQARRRLEEHPELREKPTNFLETLLLEREAESFSDEEIYGNVFSLLLAGEDTTSNSLSWTVFYLAQHPEIVSRIREEARRVFGPAAVARSNEDLSRLTYTHAVVQESLRIKPATPQGFLEANQDVVLGDLWVPKGTTIMVQNKAPQTDPRHFTEPETFRPERWMEGGCPAHHQHDPEVIFTFGNGPRFCPGKYLATNEMLIMLSALCKAFDLQLAVEPDAVLEQFDFTMHPENLWVRLVAAD